jgi:hypothetical protein
VPWYCVVSVDRGWLLRVPYLFIALHHNSINKHGSQMRESSTVKQLRNLPGDDHINSKLAMEVAFVKVTT